MYSTRGGEIVKAKDRIKKWWEEIPIHSLSMKTLPQETPAWVQNVGGCDNCERLERELSLQGGTDV